MPNIIYCYTGTGNSLAAAQAIAIHLGDTIVVPMSDKELTREDAVNAEIIGFVFPVHHWNMPQRVREFVGKVSINTNAYIFAIAACGGIAMNTLNDIEKLIRQKGAKLSYSAIHVNVSSYIIAYERFPNPEKQVPKSHITIFAIADNIKKRMVKRAPKSNPLKFLLKFVMSGVVKKFPNMDRNFVISDQCIGCAVCKKICPAKNIEIEKGKPIFLHCCEQCVACIQYCPQKAINYKDKTQNRKRYHHPDISAEGMINFRFY
jgi:ferredoxin